MNKPAVHCGPTFSAGGLLTVGRQGARLLETRLLIRFDCDSLFPGTDLEIANRMKRAEKETGKVSQIGPPTAIAILSGHNAQLQ